MSENHQSDDSDDDEVLTTAELAKLPAALVSGFEDAERGIRRDMVLLVIKDRISKRSPCAGMEWVRDDGPATVRIAFKSIAGLNLVLRKGIVVELPLPGDPESKRKVTLTVAPEVYSRCGMILSPAVLAVFPSREALSAMCDKLSVTLSENGARILSSSVANLDRFQQYLAGQMMGKRSAGNGNDKSKSREARPSAAPSATRDTPEPTSTGESAPDLPSTTSGQPARVDRTAATVVTAEPGSNAAKVQLGNRRTREDNDAATTDRKPASPLHEAAVTEPLSPPGGATSAATVTAATAGSAATATTTTTAAATGGADGHLVPDTVRGNDDDPVTVIDGSDSEETAKYPTKNAAEDTAKDTAKYTAKDTAKDTAKYTAKDTAKDTAEDTAQEHQLHHRRVNDSASKDIAAKAVPHSDSKPDERITKTTESTPTLASTQDGGDAARARMSPQDSKSQEQRAASHATSALGSVAAHASAAGGGQSGTSGGQGIASPVPAEDITAERLAASRHRQAARYLNIGPDVMSFLKTTAGRTYSEATAERTGVKLSYTPNGQCMVLVGQSDADLDDVVTKIWSGSAQYHSDASSRKVTVGTEVTTRQEDQSAQNMETRRSTSQHSSGGESVPRTTALRLTASIGDFLHSEQGKEYLRIVDAQGDVNISINPDKSTATIIGSSKDLRDRTVADICMRSSEHESNELAQRVEPEERQREHATAVHSTSSAAHGMGKSTNIPPHQSTKTGGTTIGGAFGVQRKALREVMLTPAVGEYQRTAEGVLFLGRLLQQTGVSFTVKASGTSGFLSGPSESQLDEAMSELTSASEYYQQAQLDRSRQHAGKQDEQRYGTTHGFTNGRHGQHSSNPHKSPRGRPGSKPWREDDDNGDTMRESRNSQWEQNFVGREEDLAAKPVTATNLDMYKEAIPIHPSMLFYLMEVHSLRKMVEEHGCRLEISTDGSKLNIQSQSQIKLRQVVDKVKNFQEEIELEDLECIRVQSHVNVDMQDHVLSMVRDTFNFQKVTCYVDKRNFMILGGLETERGQVKAYIQQLLERLENADGAGKLKVEEPPPPAYNDVADGSGGVETRSRHVRHSVPTVAPSGSHHQSFGSRLLSPVASKKSPSRKAEPEPDPNTRIYPSGAKVSITQGDITKEKVSAIVNAANGHLDHGGGVALAIARAGGHELVADSRRQLATTRARFLDPGEVLTTVAGRLPCGKVIHAVGPNCHAIGSMAESCRLLNLVVIHCLQEATMHTPKAKSIAFPAISSGNYGMPEDKCAQIMLRAIHTFCSVQPYPHALRDIRIVLFEQRMVRPFQVALANLPISSRELSVVDGDTVAAGPDMRDLDDILAVGAHAHRTQAAQKSRRSAPVAEPAAVPGGDDDCPVCLTSLAELTVTTLPCKHQLCTGCLAEMKKVRKEVCPLCMKPFGQIGEKLKGSTMTHVILPSRLPGHQQYSTIQITYNIPAGIQSHHHPHPGKHYTSDHRVAYLPNSAEGNRVLQCLQKAFSAGLTFTIGHSATRDMNDVVTWNDVHHKTSMHGGTFGYPDPGYLARVREELAAKGIR